MREIKFRAWIKEVDEIREVEYINFWEKKISYPHKFCKEYYLNADFDEIELMEYAGLKDMKGKEIYDGDIIKFLNGIFEVIWCNEKASFMLKNKEYKEFLNFIYENNNGMEIVGNIYENPKLMGDE